MGEAAKRGQNRSWYVDEMVSFALFHIWERENVNPITGMDQISR